MLLFWNMALTQLNKKLYTQEIVKIIVKTASQKQ